MDILYKCNWHYDTSRKMLMKLMFLIWLFSG